MRITLVHASSWKLAFAEQERANLRSWHYRADFAEHRARIMELLSGASPGGRLCVLGAGNCSDLDLERLTIDYDEVHLVDLDRAALQRALEPLSGRERSRVRSHGGVDLSGLAARIERWAAFQVTPNELIDYPSQTAKALGQRLGGPFDCVISTCLLSQMHLEVRRVLTDGHPLFSAVTFCLNLAHLRTLQELTGSQGTAFLICDVASNEMAPLEDGPLREQPLRLLGELLARDRVFRAVDPRLLRTIAQDDPTLSSGFVLSEPEAAWLWSSGPRRRFLVIAARLTPRGRGQATSRVP